MKPSPVQNFKREAISTLGDNPPPQKVKNFKREDQ